MTELPIDQSNLPRVQEVRRDFSVLEDGALAHCLQEQEIEQHYASNIQKNKLVQKDIRIAKKLQDEEDERNKIRSLEKKRQIEERDSEYARVIQEELRRKAEECRRREEEDKEIAKRLQELEQEEVQRWSHDSPTRIPGRPSVLSHENHDTEGSRTQLPTLTEYSGSRCRRRCPSEQEEEDYYFCHKSNTRSPNTDDGTRSRMTPEHECDWPGSKGRSGGTGSASDRASSQERSDEHRSSRHRTVNHEIWDDRHVDPNQITHRERTHSWEHSERTHGQHSREGRGESRQGRSRSLREQGNQYSKHHSRRHRHPNSKSEDYDDDVASGRNERSHANQGKPRIPNLSSINLASPRKGDHGLRSGELSMQPEHADQLEYRMAELELQSSDQLLRDEELARRLQEEEEKELTTARHQGQTEDFRAAQVAQDEEIAKYIQRQELKSRRRSEDSDVRRESIDESSSTGSSSEQRRQSTDQLNDVTASQVQRVSEDITTPRENSMQERFTFLTKDGTDVDKHLTPINIAEELDPTFKSKRKEFPADVFTGCSQECSGPPQTHAVPLDGFYDFMDDPADPPFVSPTKRQSDKLGRQKSRDKRENCKQQ
ncbi:trichohyalin-like isoform X2 [Ambystoma mexicanum]|uniref:trichohyalin-like isoform X2 n=1 Tax=Ambystoma mexicanum TaxID=8296 RepID=UPI0037E8460D